MKTKKASASTLAKRNKTARIIPSYRPVSIENMKIRIGEVLLCLAAGRAGPGGLQQFSRLLRQFYAGGAI